jgi:hypothetical protein
MNALLELLLWAELSGTATLLLATVSGTRVQASVALAADHLLAVVLASQLLHRGLNDTTTKAEHEMEGRLLLDVVVGQSAAILKLLTSEDETLLIRRNTFLILNLLLHVLDSVVRLNIEGDSLTRKGLDENLHTRHDEKSVLELLKNMERKATWKGGGYRGKGKRVSKDMSRDREIGVECSLITISRIDFEAFGTC